MTIIIVIAFCWILYRTGKAAAMLEAFRIYEPQPAGELAEVPEVIQEEPQEQTLATLDRLQLENDALQILSNKGVANAHIYIKMYSNYDLLDIIKSN